jgi:hypothetical protein
MTAAPNQPTLTPAQYHRNAQLFSDHYLDHTLPYPADWQMLAAQRPRDADEAPRDPEGLPAVQYRGADRA